ncbi:MAG TPA: hypothetical protein VK904_05590 [Miltoncostaeaceae bacterium]|nr:hypothetical protein [Miltoncostaeaceae bacterium]
MPAAIGTRAGLGRLSHRDVQRQHAGRIGGLEALGVERVAQEELAGERAVRALGGDHLIALAALETPLCLDRQGVLLDGEVDGPRVHARQVERDHELVAAPVGVHRNRPRRPRARHDLLGQPVKLAAERIELHQHRSGLLEAAGAPAPGPRCRTARGLTAPRGQHPASATGRSPASAPGISLGGFGERLLPPPRRSAS